MTTNVLTCTTPVTCDKCGREVPAGEEVLGVALPMVALVFCGTCADGELTDAMELDGLTLARAQAERPVNLALAAGYVGPLDGPPPKPTLEDLALAEELKKIADGDLEAEPVPETEAEVLAFPLPELDTDEVDDGVEALRADVVCGLRGAVGGGEL
jgi:hypothetical protein